MSRRARVPDAWQVQCIRRHWRQRLSEGYSLTRFRKEFYPEFPYATLWQMLKYETYVDVPDLPDFDFESFDVLDNLNITSPILRHKACFCREVHGPWLCVECFEHGVWCPLEPCDWCSLRRAGIEL